MIKKFIKLSPIAFIFVLLLTIKAGANPLPLHVEGNKVYNSAGEKVRFTGLSLPSMGWSLGENDVKHTSFTIENWNVNLIRLTIVTKFWYGEEWYQSDGGAGYRKKVADLVDQVSAAGKYIMLDLHEYGHLTQRQSDWWEEVAKLYANHPAVIFGMLNEPHTTGWELWRNGGMFQQSATNTIYTVGHQNVLQRIRETGAMNIVVAGGMDWAYSYKGFLEGNYQLVEPEEFDGNGIMYDTHIYPLKGYKEKWDEHVGMMLDKYPIIVGEFGHFGVRFEWFDDSPFFVYPYIWNNQMINWINRNDLSYAGWCFHDRSAPAMLINNDYKCTPHSGIYQKENLLSHLPDTRPPEEEREYQELYPLDTWREYQEVANLDWQAEGDVAFEKMPGYEGEGIHFTIKDGGVAKAKLPPGTQTAGMEYVKFRIRPDIVEEEEKEEGEEEQAPPGRPWEPMVRIGFELSDGRRFDVRFPISKFFDSWYLPLTTFDGEVGLLDTELIESIYFTADEDCSYLVSDLFVAGLEPVEIAPFTYVESFERESSIWSTWHDSETKTRDSMTSVHLKSGGVNNSGCRRFYYSRPEGSNGGEAYARFPAGWDLLNAKYMKIWIKGDGTEQNLTLRLNAYRSASSQQRSSMQLREFEKWGIDVLVTGNEWKEYVFRIDEFGMSDTLIMENINALSIFNRTPGKSGSFTIDNLVFTNTP